jgi:hypothetical protein
VRCLLRGTGRILKYYLDELRLQRVNVTLINIFLFAVKCRPPSALLPQLPCINPCCDWSFEGMNTRLIAVVSPPVSYNFPDCSYFNVFIVFGPNEYMIAICASLSMSYKFV